MEVKDAYKNSRAELNYKIKKYRTKSLWNENHEERLMYYIAQNQAFGLNGIFNNKQEGGRSASRSASRSRNKYIKLYKKCRKEQIKKYESMMNTNSFVKRTTLSSKPIEYLIHDNGGRPFKFVATKDKIDIFTFKQSKDLDFSNYQKPEYDVHLLSIKKFIGFWIGLDTGHENCYFRLSPDDFKGNSILIQETKTSYVSVGWYVYRFTTDEEILDYMSPVGGSDVPYPVAYSKNNVYFILDNQYIKKYN